MRIDSNQAAQPLADSPRTSGQASGSAGNQPSAGVTGPLGEDQAQLSGAHLQVQTLVAQVAQLPETSEAKVSALRQAVVSGRYHPSPDQVAEGLLANLAIRAAA